MGKPLGFRSFVQCQEGAVTIMFGLFAVIVFGIIGAAVDYGRWVNAQSRTADVLDAAVLAAGRHLQSSPSQTAEALEVASTYFNEEIKRRIPLTGETATFVMSDGDMAINGSVNAKIKTPLLGILQFRDLPVVAEAKAMLATGGNGGSELEVSLMLDVTGSMCADGEGPVRFEDQRWMRSKPLPRISSILSFTTRAMTPPAWHWCHFRPAFALAGTAAARRGEA